MANFEMLEMLDMCKMSEKPSVTTGFKYYITIFRKGGVPTRAVYQNKKRDVVGHVEMRECGYDCEDGTVEYYAEWNNYGVFYYPNQPHRTWIQHFEENGGAFKDFIARKSVSYVDE